MNKSKKNFETSNSIKIVCDNTWKNINYSLFKIISENYFKKLKDEKEQINRLLSNLFNIEHSFYDLIVKNLKPSYNWKIEININSKSLTIKETDIINYLVNANPIKINTIIKIYKDHNGNLEYTFSITSNKKTILSNKKWKLKNIKVQNPKRLIAKTDSKDDLIIL